MRHLDLSVGGLGVQHPFARTDPAGIDGCLGASHKVFLVDRADERKAAAGQRAIRRHALERMDQCGNGTGQATLHIAGAAAVELAVAHDRPERRNVRVPAVAQGDCIHVADVDEPWLVAQTGHGDHEIAASGQHLEFLNLHGMEHRMTQPLQLSLNQHFDIAFNLALIRTWVGTVDPHEPLRKPPSKICINHRHLTDS